MRTLQRKLLIAVALVFSGTALLAQVQETERFDVNNDVVVEVNTSYTNVIFETWNKNVVEVTASVEGEDLTREEKREILDNWDYEALGSSKKVKVTSHAGSGWMGLEGMHGWESLKGLEGLKALEELEMLKDMPSFVMPDFDFNFNENFNFDVDVPELDEFPQWPFSKDKPNFKDGDAYNHYSIQHGKGITFDRSEYRKDKKAYVDKLNKKYNSKASVRDVDNWLDEVDSWSANVENVMEEWGENFGKQFSEKFGKDFEQKMEKWGEEFGEKFGKDMEKWGENFGKQMEEFGKRFEEQHGKDMEKWGEEFGKQMEEWAKQFEEDGGNWSKQIMTDPHGNKTIIIQGDKKGEYKKVKATKTLRIKMPKGAKTEINVRHGEIKMADAYNVRATLNYSPFTANSIDGGNTLINAAYAPLTVNNWNDGALYVKYIDDCQLNKVNRIELDSNSSNVTINMVNKEAFLSGSFGDVKIKDVSDDFQTIRLDLDNTDAFIVMPNSAFSFNFTGNRSTLLYPKSMEMNQRKQNGRVLVNGFNRSNSSNRSFTVNASYSNIKLQ
jgi:hypothetical protein